MKVFSPLFAAAFAAAMFAPGADAACTEQCGVKCGDTASITAPDSKVLSTTDACPYGKQYVAELVVQETTSFGFEITFNNELTPSPLAQGADCFTTYQNVGKDTAGALTENVAATIKCTDPAETCDIKYSVTFDCVPDPNVCATVCDDVEKCVDKTIATDAVLTLTKPEACPTYSYAYLKTLVVGAKDKTAVKVMYNDAEPTAATNPETCYFGFGEIGDPATLDKDVEVQVTCPDATDVCTVQVNPDWACTTPKCPMSCGDGCADEALDIGKTFDVVKPVDLECPTGQFAYPTSLTVGGKDATDILVTFNNALSPPPTTSEGQCYTSFTNLLDIQPVTADVVATLGCKDETKACTVQYKTGDWGCYSAPDPAKTYTRTAATGAGCSASTGCTNRCARSYSLGAIRNGISLAPQLAEDCECDPLTALTDEDDVNLAVNADEEFEVTFGPADETMKIQHGPADGGCLSTYKMAKFESSFAAKTYTRESVAPDSCVKADDCAYKCAAEFALTMPGSDTIKATMTAVADCTCSNIEAVVSDDGETASIKVETMEYEFTTSEDGVTLSTKDGAAAACVAVYKEKPAPTTAPEETTAAPEETTAAPEETTAAPEETTAAPEETTAAPEETTATPAATTAAPAATTATPAATTPAPTTAKTGSGTSAGVSALGAGAGAGVVSVTLVAAAAGVQAIGLPV